MKNSNLPTNTYSNWIKNVVPLFSVICTGLMMLILWNIRQDLLFWVAIATGFLLFIGYFAMAKYLPWFFTNFMTHGNHYLINITWLSITILMLVQFAFTGFWFALVNVFQTAQNPLMIISIVTLVYFGLSFNAAASIMTKWNPNIR